MSKAEFLKRLEAALADFPTAERERTLDYYREIFADRLDTGAEESEIASALGNPKEIAQSLRADMGLGGALRGKIALIILTSPLWIALLGAALGVLAAVVAIYAALWATTIGLMGGGVCTWVWGVVRRAATGWRALGMGMAACGVGILLALFAIPYANRGMMILFKSLKKLGRKIRYAF